MNIYIKNLNSLKLVLKLWLSLKFKLVLGWKNVNTYSTKYDRDFQRIQLISGFVKKIYQNPFFLHFTFLPK